MPTFEIYAESAAYALVLSCFLYLTAQPLFGILQQEGYGGRGTVRWFYRRGNHLRRRYELLATVLVLITALSSLCFSFAGVEIALLVAAVAYIAMCVLFVYSFRNALKVPLNRTNRVLRLSICFYVLLALLLFGVEMGLYFAADAIGTALAHVLLRPVPMGLAPLLFAVLLCAANAVDKCYELPRNRKFIRNAAKHIAESDCIKVGITGSYGKTSVKHYAAALLSAKYRTIATPLSYNTPIGIARFVNDNGLDCDIFLAEMGARKEGDIKELCDLVCPTVGVITAIGNQHLESFFTVEGIAREKGVLAERAERVVLGLTGDYIQKEGALRFGVDYGAEDVTPTTEGTSFTLLLGDTRIPVTTPLLGRHAAEDIAIAAALAHMLGMTPEEIAAAIPAIRPVEHRLEKIVSGGVTVLDDSYNSNVAGAQDAVETLRLFGGRQYVVTPGLVELGNLEEEANRALGASLVGLEVILVGETLVLSVRQGYLDAGGDDGRLRVVPTLKKAQELLSEELQTGDAVLFLNDLPDKYRS